MYFFYRKTHWISSEPPTIEVPTNLKVVSKQSMDNGLVRINLEINGPDHMGLVISPKTHAKFVEWSLNKEGPVKGPQWNGQDTYFIYYASSSDHQPWTFSIDFKVTATKQLVCFVENEPLN